MFFVDDEGYLAYQQLINEIDAAIRAGKISFLDGVDKRKSTFYRNYQPHPQLSALETAQLRLSERNGYVVEKNTKWPDVTTSSLGKDEGR